MSTLKKRAIDVCVGDHLHMPVSETHPMAVTRTALVDTLGKVRLEYINRATGLNGWIDLPPHDWVIVDEWPYGPKSMHEDCCKLHAGAVACDCKASDASDAEYGQAAWPTVAK